MGKISEIKQAENKFYVEEAGVEVGRIAYVPVNDQVIDANHTFVVEHLRSHGLAKRLFDALINYAREENKKIIPSCSYVKILMEGDEKYHDLIANN